jgi:Coenzyme PQQ synthesis protein D (PqqD)
LEFKVRASIPGFNTTKPKSRVTSYALGDETILFLEDTGRLLYLNPTAALVWKGLESGLTPGDVAEMLASISGRSIDEVSRDVLQFNTELDKAGALGSPILCPEEKTQATAIPRAPVVNELRGATLEDRTLRERTYCLADLHFKLRTPSAAIDESAHALLGHLTRTLSDSADVVLEVAMDRQDGCERWILLRDGKVVDECSDSTAIVPMLHANILLMAYFNSRCLAAVHAAAVTRQERCVLLPAISGSGKSTLTAALLAAGFGYCTDDLALLTGEPVRVRPVPTCLGLKRGSWNVLAERLPQIADLPIYLRPDGRTIRYLPPPPAALESGQSSYAVRSIVFPVYADGSSTRLRPLSSAEALSRLAEAGYDLPHRINTDIVETLIKWISDVPCFELHYSELDQAVDQILKLS